MIYDVRHVTTYTYGSAVTFAQCTLRLLPIDMPGQTVTEAALLIEPRPSMLREHTSFFGTRVMLAQIDEPHTTLRVTARSRVAVARAPLAAEDGGPPWDEVKSMGFTIQSLAPASPAHFLYPSHRIAFWHEVTAYAARSFTPGRPVIAAARDLMGRMRRDFKYDPDATRVSTPLIDAFRGRHGVCQDYAHVMIAGLRGLGLAAAYVSGYIRTVTSPGQLRLEGSDASHAWVALWCGPDQGWIGFDPTNDLVVANEHVVLGWGRDYSDVAPLGGVLQGAREQKVDVGVDVIPVPDEGAGQYGP